MYKKTILPRWDEIGKLLRLGYAEKDIAAKCGVVENTWIKYKKQHKDFADWVVKNRQEPTMELKNVILEKALGTSTVEEKEVYNKDGELVQRIVITKHHPPDLNAAEFLLMNWATSEKWSTNPQSLRMREEELDVKKKAQEKEDW